MSSPYVGEIRIFAGNFAPAGWAMCDGQLMAISENDTLFNLIGTTYGGDGQSTFALPDLRGRFPVHQGNGTSSYTLGEQTGTETVSRTMPQPAARSHRAQAAKIGKAPSRGGGQLSAVAGCAKAAEDA